MLIHSVYFWLKPELTDAQRAEFRRGVETLATIKAVEKVYIGAPAGVPDRPIVDIPLNHPIFHVLYDIDERMQVPNIGYAYNPGTPTWEQDGLPPVNYRLTYEAMRVSGSDFFGSVTFPVTSLVRK